MNATPKSLGYHMPAEWEPHEATWLAWPHNPETWPGKMRAIPRIWVQVIKDLHIHEKVHVCVNDEAMELQVRETLKKNDIGRNVFLYRIPTDDAWSRDHGPVFVTRGEIPLSPRTPHRIAVVDFLYNAWGEKYPPWDRDNAVSSRVAEVLQLPRFEPGIVLEGGSIDVNGLGSLLTTEQCLLNKNRNPHRTKRQIEETLSEFLGVSNILWLGEGIAGDDTDGHVDDIARFVGPRTVVAAVEEDSTDENYEPLQDNLRRLKGMKDCQGRSLEVVPLPMPGPVVWQNQRLPASYANFYIGNGVVLLPVFNHPNDARAIEVLKKCFPRRRICPIDATDLIWGLGAFHCVTQQQPAIL